MEGYTSLNCRCRYSLRASRAERGIAQSAKAAQQRRTPRRVRLNGTHYALAFWSAAVLRRFGLTCGLRFNKICLLSHDDNVAQKPRLAFAQVAFGEMLIACATDRLQ